MAKIIQSEVKTLNTISRDTTVKGDIISDGDIRIDGILEGNLNCKGRLVVGPEAKIVGIISCKVGDVLGTVEGKISAVEVLSLKSSSIVKGDISMGKLSVEPGAKFTGKCSMGGEKKAIVPEEKKEK
jgi:cytoskeletal protein CcmA (bactofilin family)